MQQLLKLTEKEYQENWKNKGWNILHIGPTSSWREEWGLWESIRDIVQNSLDETEAFSIERIEDDLVIRDNGKGIAVRNLLLGAQKSKEDYFRGKFGEGLKVAALSLLRLGLGLEVETVDRSIKFVMYKQYVDNTEAETLAALWKKSDINNILGGTSVIIKNYPKDQPTYLERFTQTAGLKVIHKTMAKVNKPVQRYNYIFEAPYGEGAIFCRNIYLQDIEGPFSYDLWDFELSPDRHSAKSQWDVWRNISLTWLTVSEENIMVKFYKAVKERVAKYLINDIDLEAYDWLTSPEGKSYKNILEANGKTWERAFIRVYGEQALIKTDNNDNLVSSLGFRAVELPEGLTKGLGKVVRSSGSIVQEHWKENPEYKVIKDEDLELRHKLMLRAVREMFEGTNLRNFSGIQAASLPLTSGKVTLGLADYKSNQLLLSLSALADWDSLLENVIHEVAHSLNHYSDCSAPFERDLARVGKELCNFLMRNPDFYETYKEILE